MVNGNQSSRFSIQNIFLFFYQNVFKNGIYLIIYKNKCIMCTVLSCGPGVRAVLLRDRRLQRAARQARDVSAVQYSEVQCSTVQYSTVQYSKVQYSKVQYTLVRGL